MGTTERLAGFTAGMSFAALPPDVVTAARRAILDTIGVTIAGVAEEGSRILLDAIADGSTTGEASVLGTHLRTSAPQAALANGALGHALDFDDVNVAMRGHPSVPLLPAVLAVAEYVGAGGDEALAAFASGFEVQCRLGRGLGPSSYARGWHATSVVGSIGAAAACARLRGLDVGQVRHALGIAASMASGTRQNFGTMTKPLHAGLAARAGVEAAALASRGFTADPDILEAPLGFGVLFSPAGDWDPDRVGEPGRPWEIVTSGVGVKKYPCCYMTHQALDATLSATGDRPHRAEEVDSIEIRVPTGSISALIHNRPTTGLEGKFSMEYCVAAALLDGRVGLASFEDEQVARSDAQALLRRVEVFEESRATVRSVIRLSDGRTIEDENDRPRGDSRDPLSQAELEAKFRDCAGRVLPMEQVERSLVLIGDLEKIQIKELAEALRG